MHHESSKSTDSTSLKTGKGFAEGLYFDVNMHIELFDENGKLKDERFLHNTIPTNGKTAIAAQLLAVPGIGVPTHCAIGTGTPSATLLGAEIARVAFDTKTAASNVVTMVATFAAGVGTGAIVEEGLFNIVTANTITMYASSTFSVVNKAAGDSLIVTHTITFS